MKKLAYSLLGLTLLLFAASCSSDDDIDIVGTVYGTITDSSTNDPINNATITLTPGGKTTISGSDGAYEFNELTEGQYTITVQKEGYQTNRKTFNVVAGLKEKCDIPLSKRQ